MKHPLNQAPIYRGRFAPSPTGPLHFGSLIAAVGSFLDARTQGGEWLVRMEDVDTPRTVAGAADDILRTLETLGLEWDGEVLYQSQRSEAYRHTLDELRRAGAVYPCACSRREINKLAEQGPDGAVYPGTCRGGVASGREPKAWRVRVDRPVRYRDRLQGLYYVDLGRQSGDFVVLRADGIFAYQLAVVVDDAEQQISSVVRGTDLLGSTGRQIHLQRLLGLPMPDYLHLPIAVDHRARKLSKQTHAPAVDARAGAAALVPVLRFLGQDPPSELSRGPLAELWSWALTHWNVTKVPAVRALPAAGNSAPGLD